MIKVKRVVSMTMTAVDPNTGKTIRVGVKNTTAGGIAADLEKKGYIITEVKSEASPSGGVGPGTSYGESKAFEYKRSNEEMAAINQQVELQKSPEQLELEDKQKQLDEKGYIETNISRKQSTHEMLLREVAEGKRPASALYESPIRTYEEQYKYQPYIWSEPQFLTKHSPSGSKEDTSAFGQATLERIQREKNIDKPGMSSTEYLVKHAEPQESKSLDFAIQNIYPVLSRHPVYIKYVDSSFQAKSMRAYDSLSEYEKSEYGSIYTQWNTIPLDQRRNYSGYNKYVQGLSESEKALMVFEYRQTKEFKDYIASDKGRKQRQAVAKGDLEKRVIKKYGPGATTSVEVYDYAQAEREIARARLFNIGSSDKILFRNMGWRTRSLLSAQEAGLGAVSFPVTIPQMVVKQFNQGKTILLPDVGGYLAETKVSQTQGLIGGTFSEGAEALGFGSSDFDKSLKQYPVETGFASVGEVFGFIVGGKAKHVGRVASARGWQRMGLPKFPARYTPTNIIRKAWWKGKEKLGMAKYIPEETSGFTAWDKKVLSGDAKFAQLKGAGKQLKLFESTRNLNIEGVIQDTPSQYILGIHATPSKFRWLTKLGEGSSESAGLSVSAYGHGSPHFLRIDSWGRNLSYSSNVSLIPRFKSPTAPIIYLKKVLRLPKNLRPLKHSKSEYAKSSEFMLNQPKGSYAWIAPKTELGSAMGSTNEIEAIIRGSTFIKRSSNYYYTSYHGVVVPLPTYNILGEGMPNIVGHGIAKQTATKISMKIPNSTKEFFSLSYQSTPSIPVVRPSYALVSSSKSSSIISSNKYIPSFNTPSFTNYSSKPSSRPSSITYSIPSSTYTSSTKSSISSSFSSVLSSVNSSVSSSLKSSTPSSSSSSKLSSSSYVSSTSSSGSSYSLYIQSSKSKSSDGVSRSTKKVGEAYDVYVKDRYIVKGKKKHQEKYIRLGRQLSKKDAMAFGATVVDNSAARSFKIKPTGGKPKQSRIPVNSWDVLQSKFYPRKQGFIEHIDFAIDSPGELREISARGWVAEKRKMYPKRKRVIDKKRKMIDNKDIRKLMEELF